VDEKRICEPIVSVCSGNAKKRPPGRSAVDRPEDWQCSDLHLIDQPNFGSGAIAGGGGATAGGAGANRAIVIHAEASSAATLRRDGSPKGRTLVGQLRTCSVVTELIASHSARVEAAAQSSAAMAARTLSLKGANERMFDWRAGPLPLP